MRVASRTVASRCAMTKVVRPFITSSSASVDLRLGHRIERAGRFVEDQDRRILEQRARDGEPLALAAGEQPAALADARLASPPGLRSMNSSACARAAASRISCVAGVRLADAQILGDRAVEQQRLLEHDADIAAQPRRA